MTKRKLGGDIESNGLLVRTKTKDGWAAPMDRIHCVGAIDLETGEEFYFGPAVPEGHPKWDPIVGNPTGNVEDGIRFFSAENCELSIFHNGVGFDYLAMEKFYPEVYVRPAKAWDTFVAAKVVWPYDVLLGPDLNRVKAGKMPAMLMKSHSLKAWGYRMGNLKDDYDGDHDKYPGEENKAERYAKRWEEWNPYMASYMMQDNRPMVDLWKLIEKRVGWVEPEKADLVWPEEVFHTEHGIADIIARQELEGMRFDVEAAQKLAAELQNEKARISKLLKETFGSWWQPGKEVTPGADRNVKRTDLPDVTLRRFSEKTGKELAPYRGPPLERYSTDAPYTPIERLTFSPSSRDHLGMRLQDVFGWKPTKFGSTGKPTVDESVLEEIPPGVLPPEIRQLILDFFVVNKTLGMVVNGSNAWLHLVTPEGRIHGRMDTAGAVTGRGTHSKPNKSQVPAVRKEKVKQPDGSVKEIPVPGLKGRYGMECRALFLPDIGDELTGVDASSLELILLGHYLFPHDDGAFSARVCDPTRDPHAEHAQIATEAGASITRADAKTTIYLKVYGGSAFKLSLDPAIIVLPEDVPKLLTYRGLPMLLKGVERRFGPEFVAKMDDMAKARLSRARQVIVALEAGIVGLKDLTEGVTQAAQRGWLKALDGRKIHVRKAHAALNSVLQSAGAQVCKMWLILLRQRLIAQGLTPGRDFKQRLWIHDETQISHKPGLGPLIREQAELAMREVAVKLNLRGMLRTDGKTGGSWYETH